MKLRPQHLLFVLLFAAAASAGSLSNAVFTGVSPLSGDVELARRLMSPLAAAKLPDLKARATRGLSAQPVDPSREKFVLYIPSREPPEGYGLLVFVPPWEEAKLPEGWADVFDRQGMIFVSASGSGNAASVIARRAPLAILAEQNVVRRYHVDPKRIFIGGFSGGSRVAMRLALGYPDVFTGAFLDAGSDEIGTATVPLPPRDLFERFQEQSHLVYVTGDNDMPRLEMAVVSEQSMQHRCVFNTDRLRIAQGFHAAASGASLERALDVLQQPVSTDAEKLASCRSGVESELAQALQHVRALIDGGDREGARSALDDLDRQYGGLAAPQSLTLDEEIAGMAK